VVEALRDQRLFVVIERTEAEPTTRFAKVVIQGSARKQAAQAMAAATAAATAMAIPVNATYSFSEVGSFDYGAVRSWVSRAFKPD
jgi:hypothetical protein